MLREYRNQLLTILAGLDECQAFADTLLADPVYADVFVRADELHEMLVEMRAKGEEKLEL